MRIKLNRFFDLEILQNSRKPMGFFIRFSWFYGDTCQYAKKKIKSCETILSFSIWQWYKLSYTVDHELYFFLKHHGLFTALQEMIDEYGDKFYELNETFVITELMKRTHYQIPVNQIRDWLWW